MPESPPQALAKVLRTGAGIAAGAVFLLGVVVIFGWHTGNRTLIQVLPAFVPMQYNTALGFAATGSALLALLFDRTLATRIAGGITLLIGGLTLLQYLGGIDFGIDELFMKHDITVKTSHPGRMAPNTAVCFTLMALAVLWNPTSWKGSRRSLPRVILGSLAFGLAMVALCGYFTRLETAYGWGNLTRMAVHTAAGFVMASLSVMACAWRADLGRSRGWPRWIPVPVFIGILTATLCLWQSLSATSVRLALQEESTVSLHGLATATLIGGSTLALAMAAVAGLAQKSRVRAREIAAANEALENARETTLHELMESAPDAMVVVNTDGTICRLNSAAEEVFGYGPGELNSRSIEDLIPERLRSGHGAHLMGYFKDPTKRVMGSGLELAGLRKDGSEFPVEIGLSPFHEPEGTMAVAAIRDITKRVESEEALRESQERFDLAVRGSGDGLWQHDPVTGVNWFSDRFRELLGYHSEEEYPNVYESWRDSLHPDDLDQSVAAFAAHMERDVPYDIEYRMKKKSGEYRWFHARCVSLRDETGRSYRAAGSVTDITDQKEAEDIIKEREERFSTLVSNIPGTVYRCLHDEDWTMLFLSEDIQTLTGYPASDFIQNKVRTYGDVIHPEDRDRVVREFSAAIAEDREWTIDYRLVRADHELRWVGETGRAIRDADGGIEYLDGVIVDITRRKEMEMQLELARKQAEAANTAKSEFLSHMSHELRTPLNGILGYSQIMQRQPEVTPAQRNNLDSIVSCSDHLLALINDVLDLSKIEAGRLEVDRAPCDLHKLTYDVGDMVKQRAASKDLAFELEVSSEVPMGIITDASKVRQILINLLGNAVKFTREGGITLHVSEAPKGILRFEVTDTGEGIAPDEVDQIFEPFKQVGAGKAGGGTGLGLAITKRLTEALGGGIKLRSEPGQGSTFTVSIPLEEAAEADLQTVASESALHPEDLVLASGQDFRILVADDRQANRDILEQMLRHAGFTPVLADDGSTALECLARQEFDLVLMDVRMPGMNGIEALKRIRAEERTEGLPVIAVTASVFPEFRQRAIEEGFDDFLGKPFRAKELMLILAKHLEAELVSSTGGQSETPDRSGPGAAALPPEAATRLREALRIRNLTAINALATELQGAPDTESLGRELSRLAGSFDFDGLGRLAERSTP